MLNKKRIVDLVYAVSLLGLITSCFGVLNELFQILQINGILIKNTYTLKGKDFWITLSFYLVLLLIGLFFSAVLVLRLCRPDKLPVILHRDLWLAVGVLLLVLLPFVYGGLIRSYSMPYHDEYIQIDGKHFFDYFEYLLLYTLRSAAMTMAAHLGVILGCNLLARKWNADKVTEGGNGETVDGNEGNTTAE